MTNEERVLALIRQHPGLSDAEIRERTGIRPHQQVNQITNRLARRGLTRRTRRADNRFGNYPVTAAATTGMHHAPDSIPRPERQPSAARATTPARWTLGVRNPSTLVVIPCSKWKSHGATAPAGPSC